MWWDAEPIDLQGRADDDRRMKRWGNWTRHQRAAAPEWGHACTERTPDYGLIGVRPPERRSPLTPSKRNAHCQTRLFRDAAKKRSGVPPVPPEPQKFALGPGVSASELTPISSRSPSPGLDLEVQATLSHDGRGFGTRCAATAPPLPLGRGRPLCGRVRGPLKPFIKQISPSPFPPCDLRKRRSKAPGARSRRQALSPTGRGGASCASTSYSPQNPRVSRLKYTPHHLVR